MMYILAIFSISIIQLSKPVISLQVGPSSFNGQTAPNGLIQTRHDQCCACDEAKYELVFEGLWSKYTHPDEFPEGDTAAYFGDIIGASHSNDFRMWDQGTLATEGVKELAETGSTKRLESELKQVSAKTRTIIKARELRYSTLNSRTSAVFRTDRQHHLVSILSKLGPSPDWVVGVSGLELCQTDCSWTNQKTVNLYPLDAGTDSGNSFISPDLPSNPHEPMRRIYLSQLKAMSRQSAKEGQSANNDSLWSQSANYQNSPLYQQFKFITGYQNDAGNSSSSPELSFLTSMQQSSSDQSKPFARLTITRQRIYEKSCSLSESSAQTNRYNRPTSLSPNYEQSSDLTIDSRLNEMLSTPRPIDQSDCRVSEWSDWSSCSILCGKGMRTRTRGFKNEKAQYGACSQINLIEKEVCLAECVGNSTCYTRDWSEWARCSVDCGQGRRKRSRPIIGPKTSACHSIDLVEEEPCVGLLGTECSSSDKPGCELTGWSQWSECSHPCGKFCLSLSFP